MINKDTDNKLPIYKLTSKNKQPSSIKPEGYTHPLTQIKTTEKNFLHLKQAQWHTA